MDVYELKYIETPTIYLGMRVLPKSFFLAKNSTPLWQISYDRFRKEFSIESFNNDQVIFNKRWGFFMPKRELIINKQKICCFSGKATKVNGSKLWVDSRSFIYLDNDKLCSIDPWTKNWPGDDLTFYKWEHSKAELELQINGLALMASVDYADRH